MNDYGTGKEEPEHSPWFRLGREPLWRRLRKPVQPAEDTEVGCTCITALRLLAWLLPGDEQTEWLEEQRGYLTDLPGRWSQWSWIVMQLLAMPRYAYTVRTDRFGSLRREPADMDAPPVWGLANQVDQLGSPAVRLAWAVAVLGSEATPALAASLAALGTAEAVKAADLLRSERIFTDGPMPKFGHPLIATTVYQTIPCSVRHAMHDKAAWDLVDAGHGPMATARHLLETQPDGDRWVAQQLHDAAREYQRRGAPEAARRCLSRALRELGLSTLEKGSE
ncbi:hypothetical protein [Streptomyces caniscabiei]|uniref:HEAT repeat domain-containing protein n=1 Tax=Streptomyces caniscabiei TaxID=2746961 RepID=A0ABU4N472_9ACTN|nr:hypothetical protein [Streptomyces caniscabiei]MBE4739814.1 hypothetical protein [Streptomyces caniscabiei]MBE4758704.1 hypothetical protein [Streptomyces caniscabiei]MBE4797555.1 hypothetical protein [Streptomyces caniscabiei]MDX2944844.1 hypothetical protein [Streptomyces caniscabiei]MDX2988425.1 hypothetical protein [Streptomyces caniscabiei]